MGVLVVGAGGREHAIAWACEQHGHTVSISSALGDVTADNIDLVIPGPEAALVAGVADECARRGIPCFGPTAELARLTVASMMTSGQGVPSCRAVTPAEPSMAPDISRNPRQEAAVPVAALVEARALSGATA